LSRSSFKKRIKTRPLRILTAIALALIITAGIVFRTGTGTYCSFAIGTLTFICPLGFFQAALAGKTFLSEAWFPLGMSILSLVLLGRVFCAWGCPSAFLNDIFRRKKSFATSSGKEKWQGATSEQLIPSVREQFQAEPIQTVVKAKTWKRYSPQAVLVGAFASAYVFGFPVFCLICPVGLFFGTIFAIVNLFVTLEPSWTLLVFPALLAVELLVFKRFCQWLCPLGALLGFLSRLNFFWRPKVHTGTCLITNGQACGTFGKVCHEGINLSNNGLRSIHYCTKCLNCWEKCPTGSVKIPLFPWDQKDDKPAAATLIG